MAGLIICHFIAFKCQCHVHSYEYLGVKNNFDMKMVSVVVYIFVLGRLCLLNDVIFNKTPVIAKQG